MGRCCLTWHAALDDLFTRAVLGMKVNEALVRAGSCGTSCVFCFCFRRAPSKTKFVLLWPQSLLSSGSCSNRLIPYCKCSLPLQNTPSWPFPVFSKQQQQTRLPMLLLSTPVLFSLVDVVSAGGKGLMLSQRAIVFSFTGFAMVHRCTLAGHSFSVPPPRVQPRAARITVAT